MLNTPQRNEFAENLENKTIVVDTSALLVAGTALVTSLPSCKVVIPSIVVKELEQKRSHPTLGFMAREWLNLLEALRKEHGREVCSGVSHPQHPNIMVSVEPNHSTQAYLPKHLQDASNDSTILAVALNLKSEGHEVLVLSNDTPLRLHATLDLDLEATEYNSMLATGARPFSGFVDLPLSDETYADFIMKDRVLPNVEKEAKAALGKPTSHFATRVKVGENSEHELHHLITPQEVINLQGNTRLGDITTRTVEQRVAAEYLVAPAADLSVVSINGSAGTGKTLLSVAAGLEALRSEQYQKVMVFRSLHEMGKGQELGFLPGTVEEKMEAWAGAVYDAIDVIALANLTRGKKKPSNEQLKKEIGLLRHQVEVAPITYLRGRSLSNAFIILDEAQNFSRNEILNILSRAGEGTKMVLLWDPSQVDNKFLQTGKKSDVWSIVEDLRKERFFAHVSLLTTERSRLAEVAAKLLES